MNRVQRISEQVMEWIAGIRAGTVPTGPLLTPEQLEVADWLRGDLDKLTSLRSLLARRVEDRGLLPVPSNPHEVFVTAGRDAECRELARILSLIASSPVQPLGNGEDDDGRELSGGYRGSI